MLAEDLDPAVRDRIDEQIEFALPDHTGRQDLLNIYFSKYIDNSAEHVASSISLYQRMKGAVSWVVRGSKTGADNIKLSQFDKVCHVTDTFHMPCLTRGHGYLEVVERVIPMAKVVSMNLVFLLLVHARFSSFDEVLDPLLR